MKQTDDQLINQKKYLDNQLAAAASRENDEKFVCQLVISVFILSIFLIVSTCGGRQSIFAKP